MTGIDVLSTQFAGLPLAAVDPDSPLVFDHLGTRSAAVFARESVRLAHWLSDETPEGSSVAVLAGNRAEVLEVVLAATLAGRWITPVNPRLTGAEVRFVLDDSNARVLFTDDEHLEVASSASTGIGAPPMLVRFGAELDERLGDASEEPFATSGAPGGTMIYTSGTTGRPKGVRRTPRATLGEHLSGLCAQGQLLGLTGAGPHLVTGPLSHAAPLGFALMDLCNGAPVVVMPRWDATNALEALTRHRVVTTHLVPTMMVRLLRLDADVREAFDSSHLRTVLHGAAPVAPAVKQAMIEWWGPVLTEYWGGSEGGVVTLVGSADWLEHPGTVGRAVGGHRVEAVDELGRPLGPDETGELVIHRPGDARVFTYHGAPDATERAHVAAGAYTLGDLGWVDSGGWVFLADRAGETIISGGLNIYPAEVEQVLGAHPLVADVAVVGAPDDEWGEQVVAVIQPEPHGPSPDEELPADLLAELEHLAREHLAGYKVPRRWELMVELPRQPNGKLYRRVVRERYWVGHDRRI